MKKLLSISAILLIAVASAFAQTSGGPDAYGYTWKNNSAAGGPVVAWKDIKGIGTQITGFTDDNQKGPFTLGWNFHYYWANYGKVWIGSNGWLAFQNNSVLPAATFPTIPLPAAPNNYLAGMACDLTFINAANPAQPVPGASAWYWTNNADSLIVQYDSVPYWVTGAIGYDGRHSFQMILSGVDSSITYQYKLIQAGTTPYNMASESLTTGIENSTGQIGLQVLTGVFPTSATAVKFYYPNPVTYQVVDATPQWNQNIDNGGFFVSANGPKINMETDAFNAGNQPLTNITMTGEILNSSNVQVWDTVVTVKALAANADSLFNYPKQYDPTTVGTFTYRSTAAVTGDINPTNNIINVEMVVVDTTQDTISLSYVTSPSAQFQNSWGGNGGQGIYIEPPFYPAMLASAEFFVTASGATGYHIIEVRDDNGPGNTPGTLLFLDSIAASATIAGQYNRINITKKLPIISGGVYIGWLENGDASSAIGTENTPPLSNRNYEIIGAWAGYRNNEVEDLMIKANITEYVFGAVTYTTTPDACPSNASGTATVSVNSGTFPPFTYAWSAGAQTTVVATGLAAGTHTVVITDSIGMTNTVIVQVYNNIAVTAATTSSVTCNGGNNGSSTATIGGTAPYTYVWSNGQTNQTATGLTAGIYTVTASNTDGCTNIAIDTILQPAALANTFSITPTSCVGGDGVIASNITGGTAPYTYLWSNTQTNATATGLTTGSYSLGVTDANGCTFTANATVTNVPFVVATSTTTPAGCAGATGTATANAVSGGTSPYTFVWSNGQTAQTATGLAAGSYTVVATDSKGCTASTTANVSAIPFVTSTATTPTKCAGSSDGVASSVVTSGGIAPYTYQWLPGGQTSQIVNTLAAGTYTVITTDSQGCSTTKTVTVTSPAPIVVTSTSQPATWPNFNNGTATGNATGGTAPYVYVWSNGTSAQTISGLSSGNYTVCVTDLFGCTSCDTVNVLVNGVNEIYSGASVTISPNPFSSSAQVKVHFTNPAGNDLRFILFDIYGREVEAIDLREFKGADIDFTLHRGYNIPNGMYFYRLENEHEILSAGKIIVQ